MNYDIPVVCAMCVLKGEEEKEGHTKKKLNVLKVIFKKHGSIRSNIK